MATSAACQAALTASARRPVAGSSGVAPTTRVSALIAANPSMCAPSWIFTTSPFARVWFESVSELWRGGGEGGEGGGKAHARKGREVRHGIVDRYTCWKSDAYGRGGRGYEYHNRTEPKKKKKKEKERQGQINTIAMDERFPDGRTLVHFDSLDRFVVHRGGAVLDQLVAFEAEIDHFRSLYAEFNELFDDGMHDLRRRLRHAEQIRTRVSFRARTHTRRRDEASAVRTLYLVMSTSVDEPGFCATVAGFSASAIWMLGDDGGMALGKNGGR